MGETHSSSLRLVNGVRQSGAIAATDRTGVCRRRYL